MNDQHRAALIEEAYSIIEKKLLIDTEQHGQLRLVHSQIMVARKFKEDGHCNKIDFANFFKQSIFTIMKLIIELFNNHRG